MQTIETKSKLREVVKNARAQGKAIGFVPTMGYLHQGHLSLMQRARKENDLVVVSIFVNPTQFGPNEDLEAYPRDVESDKALMIHENVDIAFFPGVEELYPQGYTTYVEVEGPMSQTLCSESRPTHFRGVTTIVTKLFHLVAPDRAYFGQKDAQQAAIIRQMTKDLDFDLKVVVCPTVREADGLAMSSRNAYLSSRQRADAVVLPKSLFEARDMIENGERRADRVIKRIQARIDEVPGVKIDYTAVVNAQTLADIETLQDDILIAAAIIIGSTRLIDNIRVKV